MTALNLITDSLEEHRLNEWYFQRFQKDNPVLAPLVIGYLDGGPRPTAEQLGANHYALGLVLAEDARRLLVVPPPDPEPPPVNYLKILDDKLDFTRGWNLCDPPDGVAAVYPYQSCSAPGFAPWRDHGGVWPIDTPYGPGIEYVAHRDMVYYPSPQTQKISRLAWGDPWFTDKSYSFLGKKTEWSTYICFPRAGNPQGFFNTHNGAVVWEMPVGPNPGEVIAIDVGTMRWRVAKHLGGSNTNYSQHLGPAMVWDKWHALKIEKRFSTGSDGYERWFIDGSLVMERNGQNIFTGENFWVLYVEFKATREGSPVDVNTVQYAPILVREV